MPRRVRGNLLIGFDDFLPQLQFPGLLTFSCKVAFFPRFFEARSANIKRVFCRIGTY
jgi:hypothetical protein